MKAVFQYSGDRYVDLLDPDIYRFAAIEHNVIFSRCKVIVHHGGAGTTQTAAYAGRPSVVVPHGADQEVCDI